MRCNCGFLFTWSAEIFRVVVFFVKVVVFQGSGPARGNVVVVLFVDVVAVALAVVVVVLVAVTLAVVVLIVAVAVALAVVVGVVAVALAVVVVELVVVDFDMLPPATETVLELLGCLPDFSKN